MEILGNRKFVEIPGSRLHELPPLLVRTRPVPESLNNVVDLAERIVDSEDVIADLPLEDYSSLERRRMDLALNLVDQYLGLLEHWRWGDAIIEWIRQCEITFDTRLELRNLLRADVWPHAGRSSFIGLLADKAVRHDGVTLERAVGFRLTFRQPPPISCFSNQFLFYLQSSVAATAYQTWTALAPGPLASLPPERFSFEVVNMSL
jgi:hypothetical protein